MVERRIRAVFEVEGAEQSAEAVERLAAAMRETGQTEEAAVALEDLEASLADAASSARELQDASASATGSAGDLGDVARESTQQAQLFAQRLSQAASAVGQLAGAIGIEGRTGTLIQRMAAMATGGAQLGGTFGPQGALAGGLVGLATGAIPLLMDALTPTVPALQEVERGARGMADGLREAAEQGASAAQALDDFLASISTSGRRRELAVIGEEIRQLTDQFFAAQASTDPSVRLSADDLRAQIAQRQARAGEIQDELADTASNARRAPRRGGGGGGSDSADAEMEAYERYNRAIESGLERETRLRQAQKAEQDRLLRAEVEAAEAANRRRVEAARFAIESEQQLREEAHQAELERMRAQQEADDLLIESRREAYEKSLEDTTTTADLVNTANRGIVRAIGEVIQGTASADEAFRGMLSSFLESIAEQALVSAAREYAESIAAFARYDFGAGAGHLAAGAAFTGVAIATGAAAGAVAPPPASRPDSPDRAQPQSQGAGGPVTYVNNWNSPQVVAGTEADVGQTLERLGRRANQRFSRVAA